MNKNAYRNAQDHVRKIMLSRSAISGKLETLKILLSRNRSNIYFYDQSGWTLLHNTVWFNHMECTKFLLQFGMNPNILTEKSMVSPLRLATNFDNVAMVKLLLNYGADIKLKDIFGLSPIYNAILSSNNSLVRFMKSNYCGSDYISLCNVLNISAKNFHTIIKKNKHYNHFSSLNYDLIKQIMNYLKLDCTIDEKLDLSPEELELIRDRYNYKF